MTIIGVASVKIKPDLSAFRKELKVGLDSIKAEITVKVKANTDPAQKTIDAFVARQELKDITKKVDIDKKSIDVAKKDLETVAKSALKVGQSLLTVGQGLLSGSLRIVKIGIVASAAAAALSGAVVAVGALAHGLAALAPATLAVGLGGILTLGAAFATVKLGLGGIGRALDQLNAPTKALQTSVENAFQKSFTPAVKNLVGVIPQLRGPMEGIAAAAGKAATQFTAMLKTGQNMSLVKSILDSSAKAVGGIGAALAPVGHAFLEVGSVAAKVFASMTTSIGRVAQGFADRLTFKAESGALEASFRKSIATVKEFFGVLRDFGAGVANIFRALSGGSTKSFLDILSSVASKFKEFTSSAVGQSAIGSIGDLVRTLSGAFHALFDALKPVFPVLGDVANVIGHGLAQVIKDIAPLIATVATHLLDIVKQVWPKLQPVIEKLAGAFLNILDAVAPLLIPLADLVNALTPIIDPIVQLVKTLVPPLSSLLKSLAPIVDILAKSLAGLTMVFGPVLSDLLNFAAVGVGFWTNLLGITDGTIVASAKSNGVNFGKQVASGISTGLGEGLINGGGGAIKKFGDTISRLLAGQGGNLNPIGRKLGEDAANNMANGIAVAQGQINSIMNGILSNLGIRRPEFTVQGQAIGKALGDGVTSQQQSILDTITRTMNGILNFLHGGAPQTRIEGVNIGNALSQGLDSQRQVAIDTIRRIIDGILAALGIRSPEAKAQGAAIARALSDGVGSGVPGSRSAAQANADAIFGTIGSVNLFGLGITIGNSLAAGLRNAIGAVRTVLSIITTGIPLWKGPPATDRVLLKPAGMMIMQGLIDGVVSQQGELKRVLGTVSDQFASTTNSGSLAANLSSSMFVSGDLAQPTVNVNVGVNEGPLKDFVTVQIDEGNRQTRRNALTGGL